MADLLITSGLLDQAWIGAQVHSAFSIFNLHTSPSSPPIISFSPPKPTSPHSLSPLPSNTPLSFLNLQTHSDPPLSISINSAALSLFQSIPHDQLLAEATQQHGHGPLLITGQGLGGAVAALFALWALQKGIHVLCITFGCAPIGNEGLARAVESQKPWASRLIHVAGVPRPRAEGLFGEFLLCGRDGYALIEGHEFASRAMDLSNEVDLSHGEEDYGVIIEQLRERVIYRGGEVEGLDEGWSKVRVGLGIQLKEIGIKGGEGRDTLLTAMEKRQEDLNSNLVFHPSKKLNLMKMNMAQLEWYIKQCKDLDMGYYDCYKDWTSRPDRDATKYKTELANYWKEEVEKAQATNVKLRIAILFGGTNFRRMVEPLEIADYYRNGRNRNYVSEGRPHYYAVIEGWLEKGADSERNSKGSLTHDSCFWAHVEEARLRVAEVKLDGSTREEQMAELKAFEDYVMGLIKRCEVSCEIFLQKSSFMSWWKDYEGILKVGYNSPLVTFMKNQDYKKYI
ncbi:senescence-associated carboxylesterase 101 [Amborella trichopoda]|uniref:Fungal lipase-like domain-containing protein n=1 Tax=Amborella trichopoda TaxID=13333 RepID=W1NW96_AMBTC|nr:senescence-associated carboxylesterase 101 [Amborella trichopoda]ERM99598.1 hypothetical protein AMTR_s00088p00147180 [Amborella trichopoda]|eukprot:XP_006836745.1 senescence-associated carboxylesterase 101 [Amborella trichopoda]